MKSVKTIMDADKFARVAKVGNRYFIQFDESTEEGVTTCTRIVYGDVEPTQEQIEEAIIKYRAEVKAKQIADLKAELSSYDYIGVKIATGVATLEEYADKIAHCEDIRQQIRELQGE